MKDLFIMTWNNVVEASSDVISRHFPEGTEKNYKIIGCQAQIQNGVLTT
jgi:hypothetical protein